MSKTAGSGDPYLWGMKEKRREKRLNCQAQVVCQVEAFLQIGNENGSEIGGTCDLTPSLPFEVIVGCSYS